MERLLSTGPTPSSYDINVADTEKDISKIFETDTINTDTAETETTDLNV